MSKYKEIAKKALLNNFIKKPNITEGMLVYDEKHKEKINGSLSKQLRDRKHSLGNHPIFPESDESHFEEKLISKRFSDVLKNYKRHFEVDEIIDVDVYNNSASTMKQIIPIENDYNSELTELAIRIIREEFDMSEDDVIVEAEIVSVITLDKVSKNPSPITIADMEFDNHASISNANAEVYKRRFVNAMIQGSANKCNHLFHMYDSELMDIDHRLPALYTKLVTAVDYSYFINDDSKPKLTSGLVQIDFDENNRPIIKAQALTFPILIHELIKGVMEILSLHGLPKNEKMVEYVLGKADFLGAESWDLRLGTCLWEKFLESIGDDDYKIKHHIFQDLISLPINKFNPIMREIMSGTKEGQNIIDMISKNIKDDLDIDDEVGNERFNIDDLDDLTIEDF